MGGGRKLGERKAPISSCAEQFAVRACSTFNCDSAPPNTGPSTPAACLLRKLGVAMEAAAEQAGEHLQNLHIQDQATTEGPKPTVVLVIGEHARSHAAI